MKKRLSALLFAAVLLTGCADNAPASEPAPQTSDASEATSSASQTTTEPTTTTTAATTDKPTEEKPAAFSAEDLFSNSVLDVDVMKGNFGTSNPIIDIEGNIVTTYPESFNTYDSYGMLTTELTQEFKDSFDDKRCHYYENGDWYSAESFGDYTIECDIGSVTRENINVDEYTASLQGNQIYKRNAFIRKTYGEKYEFIIDPRYMYDIPLLINDYEFLKFDVNGTEFYADTLSVLGCKLNMIDDEFDKYGLKVSDDYVYASVTFKDLSLSFNSESGYSNSADVIKIEVLTEDTDSVINGDYYESEEQRTATEAVNSLIDENYTDMRWVRFSDLDFDGTPELIHSYSHENASMGEYMINDIYTLDGGEARLVGTINFDYLQEAEYGGKRGWIAGYQECLYEEHYTDTTEDGALFFALENGELYKYKFGYYDYDPKGEPEKEYVLNGEAVAVTETEPIINQFNGREISQYVCNGFVESYPFTAFNAALLAEYKPYLTDGSYFSMYDGDFSYSGSSESSEAFKSKLSMQLAHFYNEPMELLYRDEAKGYFEGAKAKPVIYLYPEETTEVSVKVDFPYGGEFTCTYPDYRDGWEVTAEPDGTLFDSDGNEYYCLYWEGEGGPSYNMSEGFCIAGRDTAEFLREKLLYMGLSPREANEFIIYWLPLMEDNNYNVISFHTDAYDKTAPLTVSPAPDSVIRVFMTWYAADESREITAQELPQFERDGFTVVEWGGSQYGK